eukprot:CAMPEP_0168177672 /NCGR_PEP_ID=MMETSP0139_2-20121125/8607_1 /TAXON_ID=44445 /ORGANISM="Pseudo-nitzschia australis, Strain 10249 10 AB" /LENGTH=418 /DNA_ID=CAMNT_0008096795 /DNA_START=82 /DNA_END=1338 /DNA_ORIENTATION=+
MTISAKAPSGFFVATAVTVAALAAAFYTERRFRKRRSSKRGGDGKNLDFKDGSEESLVNERFQACVQVMGPQLSILPQRTQLDYYGLYKQGTLGDCSEYQSEPPPSYDLVASAKYQAWVRLGGMDRMTAMQNYIEKALHYQFIKNIGEGEDQDYELEGDPAIDVMGLGDKPSTLVDEYEYEKDAIALEDSQYPIHAAAREGDLDRLKKLLESFASDTDTTTASTTSSVITTTGGDGSNTNHLQHSSNAPDLQGQTPLHLATDRGHVECVKALILAGANVNAVDHDGISILQTAVIVGEEKCCRLLLVLGADPDHADNDGDTPRGSAQDDTKLKPLFQNHDDGTLSSEQDLFDPSFLEKLKERKIFVASIETTQTEATVVACTAIEASSTKPEQVNVKNDIKTLDEPIDLQLDDDGDMF